ncbi:hypothetical protein [Cupriavidus nantongensis]|nr:hypothetical protein [Cupriavidus nantongensis]
MFTTADQIHAYLSGQGLKQASTGGGFSAWFLPVVHGWQISITNDQDTAELHPGMPVIIALEDPEGRQCECEDLGSPDLLPEAIGRFVAMGQGMESAK